MSSLPQDALQRWVHAQGEDEQDLMVYRPADDSPPPSRGGRTGFELRPDGTAEYFGPGPTDRTETIQGRWVFETPARVKIELPGSRFGGLSLEIVSVEPNRLVVRQLG